jgi:hypothetical protein
MTDREKGIGSRNAGVRFWLNCEVAVNASNVSLLSFSGPGLLDVSSSQFDP